MTKSRAAELTVTCLGLGRFPLIPGTAATVMAALVHWALARALMPENTEYFVITAMSICFAATLGSIALGPWAERFYGRKDPSQFVLDEVAGYFLAAASSPLWPRNVSYIQGVLALFVLFRLFDIVKPFPVGRSQKLRSGLGIVADDLIAGAYAALVLFIVLNLTGSR